MKQVVYLHKDKEGTVRYVGSGTFERANKLSAKSNRGYLYENFVKENGKLQVTIVQDSLSKEESVELEIRMYNLFKSDGKLLNLKVPFHISKDIPLSVLDFTQYSELSESGLVWRDTSQKQPHGQRPEGCVAGSKSSSGYFNVKISGKPYSNHRIVFKIHNPCINMDGLVIDHIDMNKSNNRIENLRLVTDAINSRNKLKTGNLPSGVSFDNANQRYIASITIPNHKLKSGKSGILQKTFSLKKYGDRAIQLAIEFREKNLKIINEQLSLGYTSNYFLT